MKWKVGNKSAEQGFNESRLPKFTDAEKVMVNGECSHFQVSTTSAKQAFQSLKFMYVLIQSFNIKINKTPDIDDLTLVVISYEIYETSLRRVSLISYETTTSARFWGCYRVQS